MGKIIKINEAALLCSFLRGNGNNGFVYGFSNVHHNKCEISFHQIKTRLNEYITYEICLFN